MSGRDTCTWEEGNGPIVLGSSLKDLAIRDTHVIPESHQGPAGVACMRCIPNNPKPWWVCREVMAPERLQLLAVSFSELVLWEKMTGLQALNLSEYNDDALPVGGALPNMVC